MGAPPRRWQETQVTAKQIRMGKGQRLQFAAFGCCAIGLLLVARYLEPNREGVGTHQQLGLPPCTFMTIFRRPCPSCGMTTAWSHLMRANFQASLLTNAGGACLAVMAGLIGIWAVVVAAFGRLFWVPRNDISVAVAVVLLTITLVDWVRRLLY
jgi:hypothetical protein